MSHRLALALLVPALTLLACGTSAADLDGAVVDGAGVDATTVDAAPGPDARWSDDGAPTRVPCTSSLGNALSAVHGRLDGYLVAIVPSSEHRCNGDSTHLHLQVRANGATYDVAVTIGDTAPVDYLARDLSLPDGPWVEGWHVDQAALLDYRSLGLRAADFAPEPQNQLEATLTTELANANHVSVFMIGYGPDGGHLVHRNYGRDGAIVIRPLGAARMLMFHFANQTF